MSSWEPDREDWEEHHNTNCSSCGVALQVTTHNWDDVPGFREGIAWANLNCPECGRPTGMRYDANHQRPHVRRGEG